MFFQHNPPKGKQMCRNVSKAENLVESRKKKIKRETVKATLGTRKRKKVICNIIRSKDEEEGREKGNHELATEEDLSLL